MTRGTGLLMIANRFKDKPTSGGGELITNSMADTFFKFYAHCVFSVKYRLPLLHKSWRQDVFKYMATTINSRNQKSIIVNGVEDHVHLLIGYNPIIPLPDIMRDVKNTSTLFINREKLKTKNFSWQIGYGGFSYHESQIPDLYQYILNQEKHHQQISFKEEYKKLLDEFKVDYKPQFLFPDNENK